MTADNILLVSSGGQKIPVEEREHSQFAKKARGRGRGRADRVLARRNLLKKTPDVTSL